MISLDEARALLLDGVAPLPMEEVELSAADGRVLAVDLIAPFDQPAQNRSAMDGYAVAAGPVEAGTRLRVIGTAFAGAPFSGALQPGTAVRIGTGGVVPPDAKRILMQEAVERQGEDIIIREAPGEARFIRSAGGDFGTGQTLIEAGEQLWPAHLGLAAAAGYARLPVRRPPRMFIFASGDEIREPGQGLDAGQTFNSAAYAIEALVRRWGGEPRREAILPDEHARARDHIAKARQGADVLVFIGGASVGERDVLRSVVEELGATQRFDRVAVQPGKPCWHARFAGGPLVLGLPGNPASAYVCAHLLLEPLLAAMTGRKSQTTLVPAVLLSPMAAGGARETYWRADAALDRAGRLTVAADPHIDSSLQLPLARANALIRRSANEEAAKCGDVVDVILTGPVARALSS